MGMRSIAVKLGLIFGVALAATIFAVTLYVTLDIRRQAIDNFNDAGLGQIRQIDGSLRETLVRSTITSCSCRTCRWSRRRTTR